MKLLVYFMIVLLVGCATTSEPNLETKIVEVKVPIFECPIPPEIPSPDLYIMKLSEKDINNWDKIAKYYVITIKQLIKHSNDLQKVLDTYKNPPLKKQKDME